MIYSVIQHNYMIKFHKEIMFVSEHYNMTGMFGEPGAYN